jgi:hypothetical protein
MLDVDWTAQASGARAVDDAAAAGSATSPGRDEPQPVPAARVERIG